MQVLNGHSARTSGYGLPVLDSSAFMMEPGPRLYDVHSIPDDEFGVQNAVESSQTW